LGYGSSRLPQFDGPDVAIFVDRMPVFIGFTFFEVHRLLTDSADQTVGHSTPWDEDSLTLVHSPT